MPEFVRSNSIAVTWSRTSCQIILLNVRKNQCTVRGIWSGEMTKETKLANLIAQGLKALNADEAGYIAAGGNTRGWGFADVTMPPMPGEAMHSALSFELKKHTPLSQDKLFWGYRTMPRNRKSPGNQKKLKLFYIRQEIWNQWLSTLETIHHVDNILPPALALNPLFLNQTVSLPDCDDHILYRYSVREDGTSAAPCPWDDRLTVEQALPGIRINPGPLADLPPENQLRFIPAILLGLYACTQEFTRDRETLIPIPQHLRIKRNITSKILAAVLCLYILGGFGLAGLKKLQHTAGLIRQTDLEIAEVQNQLQAIREQNRQSHGEFAEELKRELLENAPTIPSLPEVLSSLTGIIEAPAWISQKFEWNAGLVTFTLSSPQNDLELISRMEDLPILGDVRQLSSSFIRNNYIRRIQMNARYDTPEEKESLARKIHDEALQQKKEEAEESADQAAPAAGQAPAEPAATDKVPAEKAAPEPAPAPAGAGSAAPPPALPRP